MIIAAISIAKIIWQKNPSTAQQLLIIKHGQSDINKIAIIANSITLTPGTITVFCDDTYIHVHSLLSGTLEGINQIIAKVSLK